MKIRLLLPLLVLPFTVLVAENEIGFIEKFALAPDREAVLGQLIPGSEDYYFFHALHYQSSRQAARLAAIMDAWAKRYPDSDRRRIIENRAALLGYDANPQATLKFLRERLNLELNHEPELRDQPPDLPTALDDTLINRDAFQAEALSAGDDLNPFSDAALEALVRNKVELNPAQRRALLGKLKRPDLPGVLDLIETDLKIKESRGFGEFSIHKLLLPEQLDELARRVPTLAENQAFVFARLKKLLPGADVDAEFDPAEREAWLDRAWAYAAKLSPAFNTLKAQILYQRLLFDRTRGVYDKARFLDYLKLPRRAGYMNPRYIDQPELARYPVNLSANPAEPLAGLGPIGSDDWLVRDFLLQLLKTEDAWEPWAVWLRDTYVKPLFAEAKIVNGIGDPEKWASLLTPTAFQALKDRVDVDFAATNLPFVAPGDSITLDLLVKNAPKLIVKVYEVNTLSYFLTQKRQLNTDLNLDGLVANKETTHDLAADETGRSPFRRVARRFEFPELKGRRGAWVVEFIGGGKSSRVLVRKGQWHLLQKTGPAGDMLTVLDEAFQPVKDAAVWLDGRKFTPDAKSGFIVVPFTAQPGTKPIILADAAGGFATLTQFEHHGESYKLDAQFHIDREQLLARRNATLAVRAALVLGDAQVAIELLQDAKITLTTTTLDGISTAKEIKEVKLDPAKLFTHTFPVPERLASVAITLSGKIENLSAGGKKDDLSASREFYLNGIDKTDEINDGRFTQFGDRTVFEMLGKNGEPIPNAAVEFAFTHEDFSKTIDVSLRTDERGRVALGKLENIKRVDATLPNGRNAWVVSARSATTPQRVNVRAGEPIRIPWRGAGPLDPGKVSLLERRGDTFVKDHSAAVSVAGGFLDIKALPPGDYSLLLRGDDFTAIELAVTAGARVGRWLVGPVRMLEQRNAVPVHVESLKLDADAVVVQVRNVTPFTRVHVAATRFIPNGNLFESFGDFTRFESGSVNPARRPNLFAAGRAIGDEYRYILERRYSKTYPGNMLTRPGLLLNPWEVRSTDLEAQVMAESEVLQRRAGDRESKAVPAAAAESKEYKAPAPDLGEGTPNINFLADPSVTLYNLVPDKDGIVRVDRKALGDHPYIQAYAEDLQSAELVSMAYGETPMKLTDLRLARPLDPAKPFAEKKQVAVLAAGQSLTLADVLTSDFSTYDSLAGVHALFSTLNVATDFTKFAFILQWPKLKDDEKRAKYSEHACHELSFFLSRKDPDFFAKVVQPYLRNKKDKTFMDEYLLGADLRRFLEPWAYARLNVVERALLAQRVPGEAPVTARSLRELWELIPPDPAQQDKFFETALRGRALSETELGEMFDAMREKVGAVGAVVAAPAAGLPGLEPIPAEAPAAPAPAKSMNARALSVSGVAGTRSGTLALDTPAVPEEATRSGAAGRAVTLGKEVTEKPAESAAYFGLVTGDEAKQMRGMVRQYFRELGPTKEWAENNYYQLPLAQQNADLVTINAFWRDYAAWDGKAPFLSEHLTEATRNFTEMMFALAVLDLPFEPAKHTTKTDAGAFTLTAASPVIVFHKQIKPTTPLAADKAAELLVSQSFYRHDDRYREEGNEKFEKLVTDEFLPGVLYGANVVVTNPGSAPAKIELLLQIPQGALPAVGSKPTDSRRVRLEPYSTQTFEYFFYFPAPGANPFIHYPVNVARDEQVAGAAKPFTFKVVKQLSQVDKTSWDYISQSGTEAEVLAFLEKTNLARLDLEKVAWRARKSAEFFRKLTALFAKHHIWSEPVWRYAVQHNDTGALREWLRHQDDFLAQCGPWLDAKLISIDPIERRSYEHLEYSPLVNQRAHRIGAENKIPNPVFRGEYQHLLGILAHKPALDAIDQLSIVYYLFLQDRIEEALARLAAIKADALPTRLQLDYLRAYAALYEEQTQQARTIAAAYADYPVDRWRKLFAEVTTQLDEIEGKAPARPPGDQPDREKQQAELAGSEPAFDFKVENRAIALTWKNLREVTINYYLMDPEFLFSASPFVTQDSGRFAIIKPTQTAKQTLPEGKDALDLPLPDAFAKANVLVEMLGAGQRKAQAYHANTLKLTLAENYGRLEARDQLANKAVAKAYVKVYARLRNGSVRYFKDGYTDLRGKFDYASLNSSQSPAPPRPLPHGAQQGGATGLDYQMLAPSELGEVERLAILLMSDTHGTLVREVAPPSP